jgi:SAM-dependent methyltransferase
VTAADWPTLHHRLDRAIGDAAARYLQELRRRQVPIDPLAWTREIDWLIRGRDPDYNVPGVPLMYAVRYMPKRVISLLAALTLAYPDGNPRNAMDIGSGTGAGAVALDLLEPPTGIPLVGIDVSSEMIAFARYAREPKRHPAHFRLTSMEDIIERPARAAPFDLVIFSAPFARSFSEWDRLADAMTRSTRAERVVLAAEPESRGFLLDAFEAALEDRGWQTVRHGTSDIPDFMKEDRPLTRMTRFWRRLGSPGAYRPQTWWEPPADTYLVARSVRRAA